MPPYQAPKLGDKLSSKFVRIGRSIFVSREGNNDNHVRIAQLDHLEETIARMKITNPTEVDAGWVGIRSNGDIAIDGDSAALGIERSNTAGKARKTTERDFKWQSPGYNILGFRK